MPNKLALLLMGKEKPMLKEKEMEEEGSESEDSAIKVAASEIMQALEEKSEAKLAEALKTFIELC